MNSRLALLLFALLFVVYLFGLSRTGILGPDEPRYAAIGREMEVTGDFVTPVLWGKPWFEKPPLLYWMTAAATRLRLGPELAPRLPVALLGWGFIVFLWWIAKSELGGEAALYAACMLGTSALWIAYSFVAVTDIPLSATFCAAMLIVLYRRGIGWACAAGVLLGLAALAKGLVPLVLFAPMIWPLRRRFRELVLIGTCGLLTAAPWYIAMTARFGNQFLADFFWKQHFQRFATGALAHVQPWWFYIPVILGAIFPWTPVFALVRRSSFLIVWLAFAFVFFSASKNKLPGYMLPLLPPLCLVLGVALERAAKPARWVLIAAAFLAGVLPGLAAVLPEALRQGLTHSHFAPPWWTVVVAVVVVVPVAFVRNRRFAAAAVTALACAAILFIKVVVAPELVSARRAWYETKPNCIPAGYDRNLEYGLDYYAKRELPRCP